MGSVLSLFDSSNSPNNTSTRSSNAVPSDNGSIGSIGVTILPITFAGTINADLGTGEIDIGVASPSDSYTVSVTITDNCDATAEQEFALEVLVDDVFADGFEQD